MSITATAPTLFPDSVLCAAAHPDPYRYYATLLAYRPVYREHRLGLWVSSSNYPALSAHMNTDAPWFTVTSPLLAKQTVALGGPSKLILRVVP